MSVMSVKIKFFLILSYLINLSFIKTYKFENSIDNINELFNFVNDTEILSICEEAQYELCYTKAEYYMNKVNFANKEQFAKTDVKLILKYNKFLANLYFYTGEIDYFGLLTKKPNLLDGFKKLLIAAYFGNPNALYKMYIFLETNIISTIFSINGFENMLNDDNSLQKIIYNSTFYENFKFDDDYSRKNTAFNFLFSSSISKYNPAIATLAYKYLKGYGVTQSCETALKYYKESSTNNVKDIYRRMKPNYYEKVSLATMEYVGHKFTSEAQMDIGDIIDYFKVEAANGNIQYIQQLGQRYLYGQGIPQDFHQSYLYFDLGSRLNDSLSIFYLGELFLNGWGVEKLYKTAESMNSAKAYNSLGYMYYYGLGVMKNIKVAYDYFRNAIKKGEDSDSYFNLVSLLIEGNDEILVDVGQAYKYANFITGKGHTFGTHIFAMLNQFQLGSIIKTCEITIEFFKAVSERNLISKRKFDSAIQLYREGNYQVSALINVELAEEGHEFGQINAGLLFKNYNIFQDNKLNAYLTYKYLKMAHKVRNIFATLQMADFHFFGYGDLRVNYEAAYKLYKKVIETSHGNNFYVSHAYFHLAKMNHYGLGMEQNKTKALKFYNLSSVYEESALYPALGMKYLILFETSDVKEILISLYNYIWDYFSFSNPGFLLMLFIFVLYILFVISLKLQKI